MTASLRPPSLLTRRILPGYALAIGAAGTVVAHLAFAAFLFTATVLFASGGPEAAPPVPETEPLEVNLVEASMLKLGRELDPRQLPNRQVPQQTTAPHPNSRGISKNNTPRPDAGEPPPNAVEDLMARLGTRAEAFSNMQQALDQEGSEQGVEGATETEGDIYPSVLYNFFRRGWTVPTTIPEEEVRAMSCSVEVAITEDAHVGEFHVVESSGNADFDASVHRRLDEAQGSQLPQPPEATAAQYLGHTVRLRFHGRHAR